MTDTIILTHLGESIPLYMKACIHQISLWNDNVTVYIILDAFHKQTAFFNELTYKYKTVLVYTDSLKCTDAHSFFLKNFKGDTNFRMGYWRHVKERFFFIEELMIQNSLTNVLTMEYDVLLYVNTDTILKHLRGTKTLRMVRDNDEKGHPAFMFIPSVETIHDFNIFLLEIINTPLEDMQSLAAYAVEYNDRMHYFPVITELRNRTIANRKSKCGHTSKNPWYLSEDSEVFETLFDSLVVGQWVGGIDSRNTGGTKVTNYENESALYSIKEKPFHWKKNKNTFLWQPLLDGRILATVHVHSKALDCFLSDRPDYPKDDYEVNKIYNTLLPN